MNLKNLVKKALLICLLSVAPCSATLAQACVPLKQGVSQPGAIRYGPLESQPGRAVIDKPGSYCLKENLRVEGHYWPTPEGSKLFSDDELILMLTVDNIDLDFKKHSATSDAALQAAVRTPRGEPRTTLPNNLPSIVPKNLTLRNGTIKVSRHGMAVEVFGVGPQEVLTNFVQDATEEEFRQRFDEEIRANRPGDSFQFGNPDQIKRWIEGRNRERAELRATFMPNASAYPIRNLHIENMRIRSQDYAVVLQGAGSVVRDSVIETDSGTALWLYGPNAVIENNTFIVHCIFRPTSHNGRSSCDDMDAPIRLQHGDGAVIRNNRFILVDKAKPRAVSLFDTKNITFEGNTIVGLDDPEKAIHVFSGMRHVSTSIPNRADNSGAAKLRAWIE